MFSFIFIQHKFSKYSCSIPVDSCKVFSNLLNFELVKVISYLNVITIFFFRILENDFSSPQKCILVV